MKQFITYFGLSLLLLLSSCDDVSISRSDDALGSSSSENISVGGSLASFAIGGNTLFTINDGKLVSYDISDVAQGISVESAYVKDEYNIKITNLETIFPYGDHLFLGANDGMYIIDVSSPSSPVFISRYEHVQSCDPVVVQNDIAYVTLREGNDCWQEVNELQVIDISDLSQPKPIKTYPMESPYGLGVSGDMLFICDNNKLKVFDCKDPLNVSLIESFPDVSAIDVIPDDSILMVLGNGELNQFNYKVGHLTHLSTISNQKVAQ